LIFLHEDKKRIVSPVGYPSDIYYVVAFDTNLTCFRDSLMQFWIHVRIEGVKNLVQLYFSLRVVFIGFVTLQPSFTFELFTSD
jgi:hypothetical protein